MKRKTNFEESLDSLITDGFGLFEISLDKNVFEEQLSSIKNIISQDPGLKYCSDPNAEEFDRGIFRRNKNEGKDNKWCAHYRPTLIRELGHELWNHEFEEFSKYQQISNIIFNTARDLLSEIVKSVDEKMPQYGLFDLYNQTNHLDLNCQRSIIYDAPDEDLKVANDHFDRNFVTGAMYESHPGLFLIKKDGSIHKHVYQENLVLVFWGRKADALTNGLLPKVRHGVDVFKKGTQRDSSVFFGHTKYPYIPG